MENIICDCEECPLSFCRFCGLKKLKGFWLLEYLELNAYREKYGMESDRDPILIIDEDMPRLFLKSSSHPQNKERSCNVLSSWVRHNSLGVYETRKLVFVCKNCIQERSQEHPIIYS